MLYPSTVTKASIITSMPKVFMITQLEFSYAIIIIIITIILVLYKYKPHMNITILFECCITVFTM